MWLDTFTRRKMNSNMMCRIILLSLLGILLFPAKVRAQSYCVRNEVYPFLPPYELMEEVDQLVEQQEQVCLAVMPIYIHIDYPAFAEFASVLKYAQARGCHIMLHLPLIHKNAVTAQELAQIIASNCECYESFGVVIEGVLYEEKESDPQLLEQLEETYAMFAIKEDELARVMLDGRVYPTIETERLKEVQGSPKQIEIPEEYDFHRNMIDNITFNLQNTNVVLLVIVVFSILAFVGMIIYARICNYRKFVGKKHKDREAER